MMPVKDKKPPDQTFFKVGGMQRKVPQVTREATSTKKKLNTIKIRGNSMTVYS